MPEFSDAAFLVSSPTFFPTPISRGPLKEPRTSGPGLGRTRGPESHVCPVPHDSHGAGDCGVAPPPHAPSTPPLTHGGGRVHGTFPSSLPIPSPLLPVWHRFPPSTTPVFPTTPPVPSLCTGTLTVRHLPVPPSMPCMQKSLTDPPKHPSGCGQRWRSGRTASKTATDSDTDTGKSLSRPGLCQLPVPGPLSAVDPNGGGAGQPYDPPRPSPCIPARTRPPRP